MDEKKKKVSFEETNLEENRQYFESKSFKKINEPKTPLRPKDVDFHVGNMMYEESDDD